LRLLKKMVRCSTCEKLTIVATAAVATTAAIAAIIAISTTTSTTSTTEVIIGCGSGCLRPNSIIIVNKGRSTLGRGGSGGRLVEKRFVLEFAHIPGW
jgi:hypothetical protein